MNLDVSFHMRIGGMAWFVRLGPVQGMVSHDLAETGWLRIYQVPR